MPRRPNTDKNRTSHASHRNVIPIAWYFCPVETCRKALPSKSSYTRHIRSVHSDLDIVSYNMPQSTDDDQLLLDQAETAELQADFNPTNDDQWLLDQAEIPMDLIVSEVFGGRT